tara:strand:+ start:611 stop:1054 length:444 start_codon:yes stop_codon:yes gene_type:complete
MDFKSIMNPQRWLIGGGVVQLLFSTWLIMAPGDFAESAWSDLTARELEIATAYEMFWGWFGVPWGLWALMVGFMTSGQTQARITALTGAMLLIHSVGFFMMAESQGYGTDGPGPIFGAIFGLTILGVAIAGGLHWNMDDAAPAEESA